MDDIEEHEKYPQCFKCGHWGSVFSYKRISHEMMCGFGQDNCQDAEFGRQNPSGFVKRR